MSLTIGDTAPDFEADTTVGRVRFHEWIGDSWAVLFSHPKDFTPVCTTELGYMAKLKPEFDRRGVKIIGLSVDNTSDHDAWAQDIEDTQGARPNYPIIGDDRFEVSKLYGMLPASTSGDPKQRTPADNQTVRNVFVIGPDKKIKLVLVYPMTTGRNFDEVLRVIDSLQLTAKHRVATPVNWKQGEDVIIAGSCPTRRLARSIPTAGRHLLPIFGLFQPHSRPRRLNATPATSVDRSTHRLNRIAAVAKSVPCWLLGLGAGRKIGGPRPHGAGPAGFASCQQLPPLPAVPAAFADQARGLP